MFHNFSELERYGRS